MAKYTTEAHEYLMSLTGGDDVQTIIKPLSRFVRGDIQCLTLVGTGENGKSVLADIIYKMVDHLVIVNEGHSLPRVKNSQAIIISNKDTEGMEDDDATIRLTQKFTSENRRSFSNEEKESLAEQLKDILSF